MQNVSFHNVVVQGNANKQPWGDQHYDCENVQGVATGTTSPVPPCFKDDTDAARARQLIATGAGVGAARTTLQGTAASGPFAELPDSYPSIPMSAADKSKIKMPLVGLGTWLYNSSVAEAAVVDAFHVGYRHVDTALGYGNHAGVGAGLKAASKALSLTRGDYFVTTKVPGGLNRSATAAALELSLQELQLEQVDLVLLHWPAKGAAARQQQWLALEEFARQGKVRAIGVSHYCRQHLDDVLAVATMPVALNQVQYHVGMGPQSTEYLHDKAYMEQKGVVYMACAASRPLLPRPPNAKLAVVRCSQPERRLGISSTATVLAGARPVLHCHIGCAHIPACPSSNLGRCPVWPHVFRLVPVRAVPTATELGAHQRLARRWDRRAPQQVRAAGRAALGRATRHPGDSESQQSRVPPRRL